MDEEHEKIMGSRGVSRPMARKHLKSASDEGHEENDGENQDQSQGAGSEQSQGRKNDHMHMTHQQRLSTLKLHYQETLWIYWTLPLLGIWLVVSPFSLGYLNESLWVSPAGGRGIWFSGQSHRALTAGLMTASDIISGILLLIFGWRSLTPDRPKSLWACCFVGVWLTFAPVLFWAPTAASYLNSTVVGMLIIALTILIPGMPNMIMYMQHGPPTPPGWSYNPSSWPQRWIMIVLGFLGLIVSRYLTMFQLGYIDSIWDPFFGFQQGSKKVLNSSMSHSWPISDAGLGAIAYTFEFLMGYMGSPARWRTMPWMVAFFGFLVIPLGLTHIILVISQPVIVHAWCSMCLLAALIMLPMLPLEVDEVIAMFQHLKQARKRGDRNGSLWKIFWLGGKSDGCTPDSRSPGLIEMPEKPLAVYLASIWGVSVPWTLAVSTLIGTGIMFLPTLFGIPIDSYLADVAHLGGALVVTVAVISMGEVVRIGRYFNLALGALIAILPWLLGGPSGDSHVGYAVACSLAGIASAILCLPRGTVRESFGAWDVYVR